MDTQKVIVVFGGSFNPPLNSHFSLAEQIINEYDIVKKVVFVPVNSAYQKPGLISNEYRFQMLQAVCEKNKDFLVSRIEIDSPCYLHTIDTLNQLKHFFPENILWFTIGSDNLKELSTWKHAEDLVQNYKILVLERGQDSMEEIIENDSFLSQYTSSFICVKNNVRSNLSSTFVRDKIKRGKSIRYLTPDEVYEFIQKNHLYEEWKGEKNDS